MSFDRHQAVGAYRRWEPTAFDAPAKPKPEPKPGPGPEAKPAAEKPAMPETPPGEKVADTMESAAQETDLPRAQPAADDAPPEPRIKLPTAEEIEHIHDAAHKDGYAAGYEEATARGRVEALQVHTLLQNLDTALNALDQDIAEEILALSIEIARHMVRETLITHPEAMIDVVRDALHQLPQERALIHLNPDDAGLVREYVGEQLQHHEHRIAEDDTIARGGCRIDAAGSTVDATVQTRWRRIMENLGRDETAWEPKP